MSRELDNLLCRLEEILKDVEGRVDMGVNSFPPPSVIVPDWDEFIHILVDFYCHLECAILGVAEGRQVMFSYDWGRCRQLLVQQWGKNGHKAGFEMARTGHDGGMRQVLRTVADLMAQAYAGKQIETLVLGYWQQRSVTQLLSDADSYLHHYGHLLPHELTEGSAARVRTEFLKVLTEHPQTVRRMHAIGQ